MATSAVGGGPQAWQKEVTWKNAPIPRVMADASDLVKLILQRARPRCSRDRGVADSLSRQYVQHMSHAANGNIRGAQHVGHVHKMRFAT